MSKDHSAINDLWRLADELRSSHPNAIDILEGAISRGLKFGISDVRLLIQGSGGHRDELTFLVPDFIVTFMASYLSGRAFATMCDPWAGLGSVIIPLAERFRTTNAYGIVTNQRALRIATWIDTSHKVNWIHADSIMEPPDLQTPINVLVGCPPFGVHRADQPLQLEDGVEVRDTLGHLVLLKWSRRLSDDGVGLFIVPNSFLFSGTSGVRHNLSKLDLCLSACLSLRPSTFYPAMSIGAMLAIVRRGTSDKLFVGELSNNPDHNMALLTNLRAEQDGDQVALGRLVDPVSFKDYRELEFEERIEQASRKLGLKSVTMPELSAGISLTKASEPPGFDDRPNSVYLPLIGRSKAISSLSALTLKPHNYAQIIVKPDVADAHYVAGFLNTPLGLVIREQAHSGSVIPKITKTTLTAMRVLLPDKAEQLKMIEGATKINNLISELRELEQQIWSQPRNVDDCLRTLNQINHVDRLQDWLDTLPFPLASILWTYHAAGQDQKRQYEHLLHFFEALAEFLATVLLSGIVSNDAFFDTGRKQLKQIISSRIERSSFGTWVAIVRHVQERCAELQRGRPQDGALLRDLFKTSRDEIIAMLLLPSLVGILEETNALRNDWHGHGGIVTDRIAHERLVILETHLASIRECFGTRWESYILFKPKGSRYRAGIFENEVERIMGSRTPFESGLCNMQEPLDVDQLYLMTPDEPQALKLVPFVKVLPSPQTAQNACYFYNRRDGLNIRFVSYHFDPDAEITDRFPDTDAVLRDFLASPGAS